MTKFTVIGGNASQDLAKKIARRLKCSYVKSETRIFPDNESKITLGSKLKKGTAIIVQSAFPPVDSNLMRALSLVHKAKQSSGSVIAVIPYMGYARQDREFLPGEIVTMEVISKLFKSAGAKRLIVVDIHSMIGLKKFNIPAKNVSAIPALAKYFGKLRLKDPLVISPDLGGRDRAKKFAKLFGTDHIALTKQRNRKTGRVKIMNADLHDVTGRDLIIIDDMISTGGSIVKATEFLKKQGCRRVFVACTHALLINDALKKIKKAGVTRIVSTNTVPGSTSEVDVSETITEAISGAR